MVGAGFALALLPRSSRALIDETIHLQDDSDSTHPDGSNRALTRGAAPGGTAQPDLEIISSMIALDDRHGIRQIADSTFKLLLRVCGLLTRGAAPGGTAQPDYASIEPKPMPNGKKRPGRAAFSR